MTESAPFPPRLGLRHVALVVADLPAAERFWVGVMGYEIEWRPDADNLYLRGGHDNLALHQGPAPRPGGDGGSPLDHIGIAVAAPEHVDAWAAHLRAHGVPLESEPKTHRDGSRSIYFYGPEEVLIQVIHHLPLIGPGDRDQGTIG
jgi:catechol 2,3-dioxygenase-like lactoylglutathione lyase family enzyme